MEYQNKNKHIYIWRWYASDIPIYLWLKENVDNLAFEVTTTKKYPQELRNLKEWPGHQFTTQFNVFFFHNPKLLLITFFMCYILAVVPIGYDPLLDQAGKTANLLVRVINCILCFIEFLCSVVFWFCIQFYFFLSNGKILFKMFFF